MIYYLTDFGQVGLFLKEAERSSLLLLVMAAESIGYIQTLKYETMKARCKFIADSGKTTDGAVIFSRNADGSPNWTDVPPAQQPKPKIEKK